MTIRRITSLVALFGIALSTGACNKKSKEEQLKAVVDQLPWMVTYYENCNKYTDASADAAKTDLAQAAVDAIHTFQVKHARGKVEALLPKGPAKAPNEYSLQVLVAGKVRFASEAGKRPIKQGSPVFGAVSKLQINDCVVFSANDITPLSKFQRASACEPRFFAKFTSVAPCP